MNGIGRQTSLWLVVYLLVGMGCAVRTSGPEGQIVGRLDQTVTITLQKPKQATVGAKYQILRELPITHPITGETLKTEFRPIGQIALQDVTDKRLRGIILSETTPIKVGDLLRQIQSIRDKQPPIIEIVSPSQNAVVSQRTRLEGRITDNIQVKTFRLNGLDVPITPSTEIPINLPLPTLTQGLNHITIEAQDVVGNTRQHTRTVQYAPVRVVMLPLDSISNPSPIIDTITNQLTTALSALPDIRLYSNDDLKQALKPLGAVSTDILDVKSWRNLQTRLKIKWLVLGSIRMEEDSIEIQIGVVDLATGQITPYGKNISTSDVGIIPSEIKLFVQSLFPAFE
ncbi:hypothetical protein IH992_18640 [Candidatus Poribacteria bacterium]|nr:hypothetical protein [Candidatus Poribacteria bacterium]